jgi:KAP family P-loop domain
VTSNIPDVDLAEYFKTPSDCLLIFDDLERCSINISDVLGYINAFVEHEGFKAIIVANEQEVLKREDKLYSEIKEKLIGQTVSVKSDITAALANFFDLIKEPKAKEYLKQQETTIRLLYSQSETGNLRLLKHALWDFERFAACIDEKHWGNDEAIGILFRDIIALSIETRSGRLSRASLVAAANEPRIQLFRKADAPKTPGDQLRERYPEVDFDQTLLNGDSLAGLFFDGYLDKEHTQTMLASSSFYGSEDTPAWKTAWHGWEISDDRYEKAVATVEEQFRERQFSLLGELLHVFGLRLTFADIGVVQRSRSEIVAECKVYVDDVSKAGRLPDNGSDRFREMQSWQELGFNEYNSSEFKELRDYLNDSIAAHFRKTLPVKGLQLLELMKKDVQAYFRRLCVNNVEASPYFDIPILASIDPAVFVKEVLALDPSAQASAFATFQGRYDRGQLNSALQPEKAWLTNVKAEFEKRMKTLRPMSTNRLKNRIGHYLDPFVADEQPISPAGADDNQATN